MPVSKISQEVSTKPASITKSNLLSGYEDSDDEEAEVHKSGSDFFSLDSKDITMPVVAAATDSPLIFNKIHEPPFRLPIDSIMNEVDEYHSETAPQTTVVPTVNISDSTGSHVTSNETTYDDDDESIADDESFISTDSTEPLDAADMDDATWRRLTGKKRKGEDLNIIDVNADDALLSREEWMNRAVSQEKPTHSHSKKQGNLPSQQQKRKHQITYLAHQAKEREIELKNDWSAGKLKKQQTRAKYGF